MAFPSAPQKQGDPDFLNPFDPTAFAAVHAPRTAEQAFLFRIDHNPDPRDGCRAVIVVQSAQEPDWDYAFHNALCLLGAPPGPPTPFSPVFSNGQRFRFRLRANPTKRACTGKCAGERVPVGHDSSALRPWLERKGKAAGFAVPSCEVRHTGWVAGRREQNGSPMTFFSALLEGVIEVADSSLFAQALAAGIGPAKGFGFGLLSLAPLAGA